RFLIVTDSTGSDLATRVRFTRGRVTGVTVVVRRKVCGDRKAASRGLGRVAAGAAIRRARRAGVVLRVIEPHVERLVEARGEVIQRRLTALRVRVTDRTHRDRGRGELGAMAVGTCSVTRKAWGCGVVGALVTR